MRVPTKRQMDVLSRLRVGGIVLSPRRTDWASLLDHGWVEMVRLGELKTKGDMFLEPLRITPSGLRALADAIEKHGQPEVLR